MLPLYPLEPPPGVQSLSNLLLYVRSQYVVSVPCVHLERVGIVPPFRVSFHTYYGVEYHNSITSYSQYGRLLSQYPHNLLHQNQTHILKKQKAGKNRSKRRSVANRLKTWLASHKEHGKGSISGV